MKVLDASTALSWVIPRPLSAKTNRLREDYRNAVEQLIAPSIFPGECDSALTKSERQNAIPVGRAQVLLYDILNTAPVMHDYEPLLFRAAEISSQFRAGLYDCLYVALAEQETCEFVTDDKKLINNLQKHFPFIRDLAAL